MEEQSVLYPSQRIVHRHEKEPSPDTCYSVDELENLMLSERDQSLNGCALSDPGDMKCPQ